MAGMSSMAANNSDLRAQQLLSSYMRAGYARSTAFLQPASVPRPLGRGHPPPHVSDERSAGREFCLRPDLTIPVSRDYLHSPSAGKLAGYCYLGRCFAIAKARQLKFCKPASNPSGGRTRPRPTLKCSRSGLEATTLYGLPTPEIRIGDVGLFTAFVAALDLAPAWKRRLVKDFNRKWSLAHDLDQLALTPTNGAPEYRGVLAALAGSDPKAAHHLVTDLLSIAGIAAVGGRSVAEIAERFLEQAALGGGTRLPRETRALIERFLAVRGDPDEAAGELRALAADANLPLSPALDLFETRTGFLAARGVDVRAIHFSTAFGRGFDYYTGFVFELHDRRTKGPLIAGGRYDGLLTRLGAHEPIAAVGFAAWMELSACGAAA